eukprot:UN04597
MQQQMDPAAPVRRRKADTRGLAPEDIVRVKDVDEYKTEKRESESIEKFELRVRMEQIRKEKVANKFEKHASAAKQEYRRNKRALKQEKKLKKLEEEEKDKAFYGKPEQIKFGEVVHRPPSFDDIVLPGEKGNQLDGKRMSNLEKLQKALSSMEKDTKKKQKALHLGEPLDDEEDKADENDPMVQLMRQQEKKMKEAQREKQLKEAREKQRAVEIEKAKLQAQMAYQQMKNKRGNNPSLSSLAGIGATLRQATSQAMRDLNSVDGGVYHHGR